jgi:hypothetical protein
MFGVLTLDDPQVLLRGMWALVHGLTSLELHGLLGAPEECDRIWHDAVTTYVRGLSGEMSSAHRDQFRHAVTKP